MIALLDFDIASSQGRVCGGRGDCECKECVCQPGWSGKACNCQVQTFLENWTMHEHEHFVGEYRALLGRGGAVWRRLRRSRLCRKWKLQVC